MRAVGVDVEERDVRARCREADRRRPTDAARSTGDDCRRRRLREGRANHSHGLMQRSHRPFRGGAEWGPTAPRRCVCHAAVSGSRVGLAAALPRRLCRRANLGTVDWLVVSLALSVVLTVVVNVVLRVFPGLGDRIARSLERLATREPGDAPEDERRVRVFVPWKVMIVASVVLTILVNLVLWLR